MAKQFTYLDPEELLDSDDFRVIERFLKETGRTQIGWHYVVDLTWIYSQVKNWSRSFKVLDAGGGHGPTQFLLAEMGLDVTNVDLEPARLRYMYNRRYSTHLVKLKSFKSTGYSEHLRGIRNYRAIAKKIYASLIEFPVLREIALARYATRHHKWRSQYANVGEPLGKIDWVMGNICDMPEFEDGKFDAVVSLSSIEHIPSEILNNALAEISRVLKPDAHYAITTSATHLEDTWFHEPSKGLCFSEEDIAERFQAKKSNSTDAGEILNKYLGSKYLKHNLARFYFMSAENGMPWGNWNPQYIPVGIYS